MSHIHSESDNDNDTDTDIDDRVRFLEARSARVSASSSNQAFRGASSSWTTLAMGMDYTHNFDWCGLPIIQFPQDVVVLQEIVWRTKPNVIIETGVARGGSLILYASLMNLLDQEELKQGVGRSSTSSRRVVGIDVDIREHNRKSLDEHFLRPFIDLIQGSSTDAETLRQLRELIPEGSRCMVVLDSLHTESHVRRELEAYAGFVSPGCYLVVLDTFIDGLPESLSSSRPWGPGNSPETAVNAWLTNHPEFRRDSSVDGKLGITCAPGGFLLREG